MKEKVKAILFLILFAPLVGEGLSTSTPAVAWLNPVTILLLVALYGFGALLVRELLIRWDKGPEGWSTILLLGLVYGIIEEGLYLMSFFNPNWEDVGPLGSYGRALGVNWVWVVELAIFHMIFSITIPIMLTHIAFPQVKEESWLSKKAFFLVVAIFILCGPIWMLFVISTYNYIPGIAEYIAFLIIAVILVVLAKKAPFNIFTKKEVEAPGFKSYFVYGLIWGVGFFLMVWLLPAYNVHPLITILLLPAWTLLIIWRIATTSGNGYGLTGDNQLGLIIGALCFLFFLLLIFDIIGFVVFGLISVVIFIFVKKRINQEKNEL
ncbi:MAG: hypothetical protein ACFFAO_01520 [Candidatus Hermodarchaeota archaeon]